MLQVEDRVQEVPVWWHSIQLESVVTPGQKSPAVLRGEWEALGLGDLTGRTVLDIGAWDGYFSFAAEQAGADRVVALDHYTWSMDLPGYNAYRARQIAAGQPIVPAEHTEYWHPDTLPGKAGFDLAREALGSRVEPIVGDLMVMDLGALGQFDVVLYLGVLYHMRHPLLALERLRQVTRDVALIETQATVFRHRRAVCEFFPGSELNHDPSNWWSYSPRALIGLAYAAGFNAAQTLRGPSLPRRLFALAAGAAPYRAVVRASVSTPPL